MIVIAGTIELDPSKRAEAFVAARQIMTETHKEPGNIAYVFSSDLNDDGLVHIFEQWESQEALDFHFKTPHMAEFQGKIGSLGVKEMKIQKYEISSVGSLF
jgi:quinol monooxygenase YgiN